MTVHDTTYFLSEPEMFNHRADITRWHDSYHFLKINNPTVSRGNYGHDEILKVLEKRIKNDTNQ